VRNGALKFQRRGREVRFEVPLGGGDIVVLRQ
jgi:hypothetical protein